jgi:hypothetical protein
MVGLGYDGQPIRGVGDLIYEIQKNDGTYREAESEQYAVDCVFCGFVQARHVSPTRNSFSFDGKSGTANSLARNAARLIAT